MKTLYNWWSWSRTIFINAAVILLSLLMELVTYALSVEWASVFSSPSKALAFTIGLNVLNIVLRYVTTKPVGEKHETFISADASTVLPANSSEVVKLDGGGVSS